MIEKQPVKKAGRIGALKQGMPIFLLLMLLAAVVAASGGTGKPSAIRPIQVYLSSSPASYCAFPLMENGSSRYAVTLEKDHGAVIAALNRGAPDAAIVPAQLLSQVNADVYAAAAVTSFLNLVVVQNGGTAASLFDLNGKEVIFPDTMLPTPEYQMLEALLAQTKVKPILLYEKESAIAQRAQTGDFDFMILPVDKCAALLMKSDDYRTCFNLAGQWASILGTTPPAGDCLVVRKECITQNREAVIALLKNLQTGVNYANAKHKKAAQIIATLGLGGEPVSIMKTLPHCAFCYQEGSEMEEALKQLAALARKE